MQRITQRLRLTEAKAAFTVKTGRKITNRELSKRVFSDDPDMSDSRKEKLLSEWDAGRELGPTQLHMDRLQRMAKALKCNVVDLAPELKKEKAAA